MILRLTIIYILNLFDLIFTKYMVNKYGLEFELNPIGRLLLHNDVSAILYKVVIVGILVAILYFTKEKSMAKFASWVVFIIFVLLTIYHIIGYILIK